MDHNSISSRIIKARKKLNLTQQQLAEKLCVTNKAVSKWERGVTIPDVTLLLPLSQVLGISVQQLLDSSYEEYGVSEEEILSRGCIGSPLPDSTDKAGDVSGILNLHINTNEQTPSSPYLFSHNLEHTRGCLYRGLSAQLLRNRKFAGRPQARLGVSAEWFGYGHMEGPMQPEQYAAMAKDAALAMRAVSPDLEICSSGQYQDLSRAESWVEKSALLQPEPLRDCQRNPASRRRRPASGFHLLYIRSLLY